MASEVGVLDIDPAQVSFSGRLEPGKLFFIDTEAGRIVEDHEIKEQMARQQPYGAWLKKNMLTLKGLPSVKVTRAHRLDALRLHLAHEIGHHTQLGFF